MAEHEVETLRAQVALLRNLVEEAIPHVRAHQGSDIDLADHMLRGLNSIDARPQKGAGWQTEVEFLNGWLTQMAERFELLPYDRIDLMSLRAAVQGVIKMLDEHERLQ
jgi:hypothetical protein